MSRTIGISVVLGLSCLISVSGCLQTPVPDRTYCANNDGDRFCMSKEDNGGRNFCVSALDRCAHFRVDGGLDADNDGCVASRPTEDECYSPCGLRRSVLEEDTCLVPETTTTSGAGMSTSDGGTTSGSGGTTTVGSSGTKSTTIGADSGTSSTTIGMTASSGTADSGSGTGGTTGACQPMEDTTWSGCILEFGVVGEMACPPDATCIVPDELDAEGWLDYTLCSYSCDTQCDCPVAPPGVTAIPTCEANLCYLNCDGGELSCPEDMVCHDVLPDVWACVEPTPLEPAPGSCAPGCEGDCVSETVDGAPPFVCSDPCFTAATCEQGPEGWHSDCGAIAGVGVGCYLPCHNDLCPTGMVCAPDMVDAPWVGPGTGMCMWPVGGATRP